MFDINNCKVCLSALHEFCPVHYSLTYIAGLYVQSSKTKGAAIQFKVSHQDNISIWLCINEQDSYYIFHTWVLVNDSCTEIYEAL